MVFYRKYRSQTLNELDNANVRETLTSYLTKDPPHAFLFTGPKGLGKTSAARIVAKVVNCEHRSSKLGDRSSKDNSSNQTPNSELLSPAIEPCNICEQCLSITNGTNMDVIEIDAASNRGIDEIRDLKEKIRLSPVSAKKKIYIIDEVHMLTTEAFNALLKTLEEPPSHALFILCTTESHKVPATIFSRCCHVSFQSASKEELVRAFKRIVTGEKLDVEDGVLEQIADLADGGFRDGTKILEEIVALSPGKITKEVLEQKYHIVSISGYMNSIIESIENNDVKKGIETVKELTASGIDIKYFLTQVLETFHDLLMVKVGITANSGNRVIHSDLSVDAIKKSIELFSKAYSEMKYTVITQLPIELALIELCHTQTVVTVQKKEEETPLRSLPRATEGQATSTTTVSVISDSSEVTVSSLKKQLGDIAKIKALYGETKEPETVKEEIVIKTTDLKLDNVPANEPLTAEWLSNFWKCLISEMKSYNHTMAGILRGCMIKSFDKENLIIETAFTFHKEKLEQAKSIEALHTISKALTGKPIAVVIILKKS